MIYKFISGTEIEVKDIETPEMWDMFQINLPSEYADYVNGNGEGVWACGDKETLQACREDAPSGVYFVKILTDSMYYPSLKSNTIIPVEMRGEYRPVAILEELQKHFGSSQKEYVISTLSNR